MITDKHVEMALAYMRDNAAKLGQAKANRVYLEQFRKSKKALLFSQAPSACTTIADKESWAYANDEYLELLEGLKAAIEAEEELKWMMHAASMKVEVWRTQQATARAVDRGHQ
jgi:hypothetical protein